MQPQRHGDTEKGTEGKRKIVINEAVQDPYVDAEDEPNPELNRITNAIIGAAIHVHKELGPGLTELMYENALSLEFDARGIRFERQVPLEVRYRGKVIGKTRLDFIVEGKVVLEIKSVEKLVPVHKAQLITYLKITRHKLGILLNFNVPLLREGIQRVAN